MKPAASIQTVIECLETLKRSYKPADSLLSGIFRNRRYMGSKDRAFVAERYYRILRHQARYGWWIKKMKLEDTPRTQTLLDILFYDRAEDLGHFFDGSLYGPETLNQKEKKAADYVRKQNIHAPDMDDGTRFECPLWLAPKLKAVFGENFEEEMQEMLKPALLHLRVNTIKSNRQKAQDMLAKDNIITQKGVLSPLSLIVEGRPALSKSEAFTKGIVEIQDEGSQLIGLLCEAKPGQQVIDFCAGAGGKTLAIAALMNNKGRVIASDVLAGKLKRAQVRFRRAGLHNIETRLLSSEKDKWVKKSRAKFDIVLTDVPCSGTGTWKRNPDMKWRFSENDLEELMVLQQSILESASRLVKPGGRLVYATCSLLPEENNQQISAFLLNHDDFDLVPIKDVWPQTIGKLDKKFITAIDQTMQLSPALTKTDGFFAAIMQRKMKDNTES